MNQHGQRRFTYASDWLADASRPAISFSLPKLIVGNADAHGKNFGLLCQENAVRLAPFYDLLSTVAYPDLSPNLAMKIAKRATLEEIGPTTWKAFAEDIGLPASFVCRRVRELSDAVSSRVALLPASAGLTALDASAPRPPGPSPKSPHLRQGCGGPPSPECERGVLDSRGSRIRACRSFTRSPSSS